MWWYSVVGLRSSPVLARTQGCSDKRNQLDCCTNQVVTNHPSPKLSIWWKSAVSIHSCRKGGLIFVSVMEQGIWG
ncbi:hypothetical protein TNCT_244891 [Trichonephila clavata]|uniref:Uncharacterized protein n=1 Tax=Trichonephila clavata TaxID=2740835 RepID=A0A8X6FFC6_TRICU|nr:hypothetical protein TNCT_244891 [Trichonephila clavata]